MKQNSLYLKADRRINQVLHDAIWQALVFIIIFNFFLRWWKKDKATWSRNWLCRAPWYPGNERDVFSLKILFVCLCVLLKGILWLYYSLGKWLLFSKIYIFLLFHSGMQKSYNNEKSYCWKILLWWISCLLVLILNELFMYSQLFKQQMFSFLSWG